MGPQKTNPSALLTAEEFALGSYDVNRVELVVGRVIELPGNGLFHGLVSGNLCYLIGGFVDKHDLGDCFACHTWFVTKRNPDSVRGTDLAFVSHERWPKDRVIDDGPLPCPPNLVCDVVDAADDPAELRERIGEFLASGINAVLTADLKDRSVHVHRSAGVVHFQNNDIVTIPEILPGFAVKVTEFFE